MNRKDEEQSREWTRIPSSSRLIIDFICNGHDSCTRHWLITLERTRGRAFNRPVQKLIFFILISGNFTRDTHPRPIRISQTHTVIFNIQCIPLCTIAYVLARNPCAVVLTCKENFLESLNDANPFVQITFVI